MGLQKNVFYSHIKKPGEIAFVFIATKPWIFPTYCSGRPKRWRELFHVTKTRLLANHRGRLRNILEIKYDLINVTENSVFTTFGSLIIITLSWLTVSHFYSTTIPHWQIATNKISSKSNEQIPWRYVLHFLGGQNTKTSTSVAHGLHAPTTRPILHPQKRYCRTVNFRNHAETKCLFAWNILARLNRFSMAFEQLVCTLNGKCRKLWR